VPIPRPLVALAGAVLLGVGLLPAALAGAASAASPATVTVSPSSGLDRSGQTVSVSLSGVPAGAGVYLQWCPDNPAGTRWPAGTCASAPQVWLSSNPAALAQGASALTADPVDLAVTPTITTAAGTTDCRSSACAVFLRLDHFSPGDTSLDTFVPVSFVAETTGSPSPSATTSTPAPEVPAYAVSATPTTGLDADADTVAVTITGLAADAGVYVRLCALGTGGRPAADACDGQGRWVRETYPYGPYPTDGSVVKPSAGPVTLDVRARFGSIDCTAVACGVHVRRDHLAPSDTALDRAIPLTFATASPAPTTSGSPEPSPSPSTSTPTRDARVDLGSATAAPGGSLTLTGTGFAAGERVLVELHSDPVELGTATATAAGEVDTTVTVPASTPAGEHTVVLTGQSSGRVAEAALVVVAATPSPSSTPTTDADADADADADGTLATTGGSPLAAATLATLLLAAGAALLLASTRRRHPRH
jgi:hypothetical protein